MQEKTDTQHEPTEEEIQHAAYYLWLESGRPTGSDLENWFAAKELLRHHHGRTARRSRRAAPLSVTLPTGPLSKANN